MVCVVGEFNAGKSRFINALLGDRCVWCRCCYICFSAWWCLWCCAWTSSLTRCSGTGAYSVGLPFCLPPPPQYIFEKINQPINKKLRKGGCDPDDGQDHLPEARGPAGAAD